MARIWLSALVLAFIPGSFGPLSLPGQTSGTDAFSITLIAPAAAQSLSDRIDRVRNQQRDEQRQRERQEQLSRMRIMDRMGVVLTGVDVEEAALREVFRWWSQNTDIPTVVEWRALEMEGINPDKPINLRLSAVPAGQLLALIMQMAEEPGVELVYEITPWYIEVLSKRMANRRTVTRVYQIGDLIMQAPDHSQTVPQFNLEDALDNASSRGRGGGAGGGTGQGGLFGGQQRGGAGGGLFGGRQDGIERTTPRERGEALAQLIRETIEPEIWIEHGGEFSSIRYMDNKLIVTAPIYVQRQIGPTAGPVRRGFVPGAAGDARGTAGRTAASRGDEARATGQTRSDADVGGVAPRRNHSSVGGVSR